MTIAIRVFMPADQQTRGSVDRSNTSVGSAAVRPAAAPAAAAGADLTTLLAELCDELDRPEEAAGYRDAARQLPALATMPAAPDEDPFAVLTASAPGMRLAQDRGTRAGCSTVRGR